MSAFDLNDTLGLDTMGAAQVRDRAGPAGHRRASRRVPRISPLAAPAAERAAARPRGGAGSDAHRGGRRAHGGGDRSQHGAGVRPGRPGRIHPLPIGDQGHPRRRGDVRDDRPRDGLRPRARCRWRWWRRCSPAWCWRCSTWAARARLRLVRMSVQVDDPRAAWERIKPVFPGARVLELPDGGPAPGRLVMETVLGETMDASSVLRLLGRARGRRHPHRLHRRGKERAGRRLTAAGEAIREGSRHMRFLATTIPLATMGRACRAGCGGGGSGQGGSGGTGMLAADGAVPQVTSGPLPAAGGGRDLGLQRHRHRHRLHQEQRGREYEDIGGVAAGTMGYKVSETIKTSTQLTWYESTATDVRRLPRPGDRRQRPALVGGLVHAVRSAGRRVARPPVAGAAWTLSYMDAHTSAKKPMSTNTITENWTTDAVDEVVTEPAGTFKALKITRTNTADGTAKSQWFVAGRRQGPRVEHHRPPRGAAELQHPVQLIPIS